MLSQISKFCRLSSSIIYLEKLTKLLGENLILKTQILQILSALVFLVMRILKTPNLHSKRYFKRHVDLLLIKKDDQCHYFLIKSFNNSITF